MTPAPSPRIVMKVERSKKIVDFKKVVDILMQQGIIEAGFTGDIRFEVNRGGITRCQKVENIR